MEAVAALGNKVVESLRAQDPSEGLGLFPNVCVVLTGAGSELTSPRPTPAGRGGRGGARRSVWGSSGCSRPCSDPVISLPLKTLGSTSSLWTPAACTTRPRPSLDLMSRWRSSRRLRFSFSFDHADQRNWLRDQLVGRDGEDPHHDSAAQPPEAGPGAPLLVLVLRCWETWGKFKHAVKSLLT